MHHVKQTCYSSLYLNICTESAFKQFLTVLITHSSGVEMCFSSGRLNMYYYYLFFCIVSLIKILNIKEDWVFLQALSEKGGVVRKGL